MLDGVYRRTEGGAGFQQARAPTRNELRGLLDTIIARLMKMLTRQGHLVEEQGMTYLADIGADSPLRSLQAASCTYRIAFGPRAGQKVRHDCEFATHRVSSDRTRDRIGDLSIVLPRAPSFL